MFHWTCVYQCENVTVRVDWSNSLRWLDKIGAPSDRRVTYLWSGSLILTSESGLGGGPSPASEVLGPSGAQHPLFVHEYRFGGIYYDSVSGYDLTCCLSAWLMSHTTTTVMHTGLCDCSSLLAMLHREISPSWWGATLTLFGNTALHG